MIITPAKRTLSVKEYYFSIKNKEIAEMSAALKAEGKDPVVNLGIGAPNGVPPQAAIKTLCETAVLPDVHKYQSYAGNPELREAFSKWYKRYYKVDLNPANEIQPLMGSKEGILLISMAFVDKGDKILIPDPGYPTYTSSAELVEAEVVKYDLTEENGWLPDFDALEKMDLTGVKLMWTNYPSMPTGASASPELYQKLADFGNKHKILIVNDNPYSFILNSNPISILAANGAKECCLEMNSLSKAHNMSGWRVGMVAGQADYIKQILKVKSQMDSGMFKPIQMAAIAALAQGPEWFAELNAEYERRRVSAGKIMDLIGAKYNPQSSGLFLWGRVPKDSPLLEGTPEDKTLGERISDKLLYNANVFVTPGFIFGKNGKDYVRISLCANVDVLEKAVEKVKALL